MMLMNEVTPFVNNEIFILSPKAKIRGEREETNGR